jgi:hypothetical protein
MSQIARLLDDLAAFMNNLQLDIQADIPPLDQCCRCIPTFKRCA